MKGKVVRLNRSVRMHPRQAAEFDRLSREWCARFGADGAARRILELGLVSRGLAALRAELAEDRKEGGSR